MIFGEGPIDCPEMTVRSYHSTLCKIPKIAGFIDVATETWNQERVDFEFCETQLGLVQNFVYCKMVGVLCG